MSELEIMQIKPINSVQEQLLQVLTELPKTQQQQVLKFALSLRQKNMIEKWNAMSDGETAALKAEFADEDLALAEAILVNYLPTL